jgi:hypothetical protein
MPDSAKSLSLLRMGASRPRLAHKKIFAMGNRPNLKSSLCVRRAEPGAGRPVGLTGPIRIGYIAVVIEEETAIVGPWVRDPTPEESTRFGF